MKIASWNVNGVRARLDHVTSWLLANQPDVLALQETKVIDDIFPFEAFEQIGYKAKVYGQKSYNGVALLTKGKPKHVAHGIDGYNDEQARVISATYNDIRVVNVYIPNGQTVGSEKFNYKMNWLKNLLSHLEQQLKTNSKVVVLGDFNIAPHDDDVHDPGLWKDKVLCSDDERRWLKKIMGLGFIDSFRLYEQKEGLFSWWDYRAAAYRRKMGLRIDLILISEALKKSCVKGYIDETPRGQEKPSDHTPVLIELN